MYLHHCMNIILDAVYSIRMVNVLHEAAVVVPVLYFDVVEVLSIAM